MKIVLLLGLLGACRGLVVNKCCPRGQTLGKDSCVRSEHPLLHPFRPPPIYRRRGQLLPNATYEVAFGRLPKCRLLYYLEPQREPGDVFWLLSSGTVVRVSGDPLPPGNYCLEAIPKLGAVLPVLCFPEGEEEGVGVFAVYPVGMLVSIPFLAATLVVYTFFRELANLHGRCLVCHVTCLLIGYSLLATIQIDTTAFPYRICLVMGYAIQFFFMATFFWLNVMCFDIYWAFSGLRNLTGSVKERERKKLIVYSVYAWCTPLLILVITVAVDLSPSVPVNSFFKPRVGEDKCFFKEKGATWIYFYLPMALIILSNIVLFGITAFRIWSHRRETAVLKRGDSRKHDSTNDKESLVITECHEDQLYLPWYSGPKTSTEKYLFTLYLKLFIVMGINWVMELLSSILGGPSYLWYIPDFTNTLQGLFIFLIFVWKKRVRRLVWARLRSCFSKETISSGPRTTWSGASSRNTNSTNSTHTVNNSIKMNPGTQASQTTLA